MDPAQTESGAPRALEARPRAAFPLFLAAIGTWFVAWGMQNVLFQWLVVEELGASAGRVGTAQMALLLH